MYDSFVLRWTTMDNQSTGSNYEAALMNIVQVSKQLVNIGEHLPAEQTDVFLWS